MGKKKLYGELFQSLQDLQEVRNTLKFFTQKRDGEYYLAEEGLESLLGLFDIADDELGDDMEEPTYLDTYELHNELKYEFEERNPNKKVYTTNEIIKLLEMIETDIELSEEEIIG